MEMEIDTRTEDQEGTCVSCSPRMSANAAAGTGANETKETPRPKETMAATFLKMDRFADRLAVIRSQIHERERAVMQPCSADRCVVQDEDPHGHRNRTSDSSGSRRAPLVPASPSDTETWGQTELPPIANAPFKHSLPPERGFLSVGALQERAQTRERYVTDVERVARVEAKAAQAVQDAERLSEEARIAMVMYSHNEKNWNFDERAKRYQLVMQAKKVAEAARMKADDERIMLKSLHSQMSDPYASMRLLSPMKSDYRAGITARADCKFSRDMGKGEDRVLVWLIASPTDALPITPRQESDASIIDGGKELSSYVVYYGAASQVIISQSAATDIDNDKPPGEGWLSCSAHGILPAPVLKNMKSTMETWLVAGAGAGIVNGKYIIVGEHNNTRRFKSSAGLELFRKSLLKSSSIIKGFVDTTENPVMDADRSEVLDVPVGRVPKKTLQQQLPSTLKSLESDDSTFRSMERIGAWLGSNEITQRRQSQRDGVRDQPSLLQNENVLQTNHSDGDKVTNQESSLNSGLSQRVVNSRPEVTAILCKEWVLLAHCSRRIEARSEINKQPARNLGLGCLKRHYYISIEEKQEMTTWAQEQESWLVKDALSAIIRRETCLARLETLCKKCMVRFQENMQLETEKYVKKILCELNRIRFLTVKVFETIEEWRVHTRKVGFVGFHDGGQSLESSISESESPLLGWSSSITVSTGKHLYKGSNAFVSRFKRFCRPSDPSGKKEKKTVYLGYFRTKDEAEQAYDEFAAAEARRLNTTVAHLPRRRNVFRSCGRHFAVESERVGPDYCIECKIKQLSSTSSTDEWNPPFFFTQGENYILKLSTDLNFLNDVSPLKMRLDPCSKDGFPLLGNVFVLPKTPIQDPQLAMFVAYGAGPIPRVGETLDNQSEHDIADESLDRDRILRVQTLYLQELQIYQPELFESQIQTLRGYQDEKESCHKLKCASTLTPRVVQAMYWDRCAALCIQQARPPMAHRRPGIWCRPDAGEWASFLVRGKHQKHLLFKSRLELSGKEMQERRRKVLNALRKLIMAPLYSIPSREVILRIISDGEQVKSDVVLLEVKNTYKYLDKYDRCCVAAAIVQRWFRGVKGRLRVKARRAALELSTQLRQGYGESVSRVARQFYPLEIAPIAIRRAIKKLVTPAFAQIRKMDGEYVSVTVHAIRYADDSHKVESPHICCHSCARRFRVYCRYSSDSNGFRVSIGVCSCQQSDRNDQEREAWFIRVYNPTSNVVYRAKLENSLLRQVLKSELLRVESQGATIKPQSHWNPVFEMDRASEAATTAAKFNTYIHQRASEAQRECKSWRILYNDAIQRAKTISIELDHAIQHRQEVEQSLLVATVHARRTLDFTSRNFHEAQAWDPLENANDRQMLIEKRRLQKLLVLAEKDRDKRKFDVFQANDDERYLAEQATRAQQRYESRWAPLIQTVDINTAQVAAKLDAKQAMVHRAMNTLVRHRLTLRDSFFVPTRRSLQLQPSGWRGNELSIAIPGLIRGYNIIRRRIVKVSFCRCEGSIAGMKRLIVGVSAWRRESENFARPNLWLIAYDPGEANEHRLYLKWGSIQLLIARHGTESLPSRGRLRLRRVADILLSLATFDRITGAFTLHKLRFFQCLELLSPRLFVSHWFTDQQQMRKSGEGDEILRQVTRIDRRLCFAIVYEKWGDLTVVVYCMSSSEKFQVTLTIDAIFKALYRKPFLLHLWICCVKINSYSPVVLRQILKHLRFESFTNRLYVPSGKCSDTDWAKICFRTSALIQGRRVLISIRDHRNGDCIRISVFDLTTNSNFTLQLEWEMICRQLKPSEDADIFQRSKALSLAFIRNRQALYAWVCERLRFQKRLEHPDTLTAAQISGVTGQMVRHSFNAFNNWIKSSHRIPLRAVGISDIDRYCATVDASVLQGICNEQIVFISEKRVPVGEGKIMLGTEELAAFENDYDIDEVDTAHLRADFFVRADTVYARVRSELESERADRIKRELRETLWREDVRSLQQEIAELGISLISEVYSGIDAVRQLCYMVQERRQFNYCLRDELMNWLIQRGLNVEDSSTDDAENIASDSEPVVSPLEYDKSKAVAFMLCLRRYNGDAFALFSDNDLFSGTLQQVESNLNQLLNAVEMEMLAPLMEVWSSIDQLVLEATWQELEALRHGIKLSQSLLVFDSICSAVQDEDLLQLVDDQESARGDVPVRDNASLRLKDDHKLTDASVPDSIPPRDKVITQEYAVDDPQQLFETKKIGLLLYPQTDHAFEEVIIASAFGQGVNVPYSLRIRDLLSDNFQLISRHVPFQLHGVNRLRAKRIRLGILVYVEESAVSEAFHDIFPWNVRASAIADEMIRGVALLIPNHDCSDLLSDFHIASQWYHSISDPSRVDDSCSRSALNQDRRRSHRSKKQLAWKQHSIERMQTTRKLRQQQQCDGLALTTIEDQRELLSVSSVTISQQELKSLTGDLPRGVRTTLLVEYLELVKDDSENGVIRWKLQLKGLEYLDSDLNRVGAPQYVSTWSV